MKNKLPLIGLVFSAFCGWSSSIAAAEFVALDPVGTTLEDFFTAALDYSPRLKIAEESMKIGSARKRIANGRLLPQLNATANVSDNRRNVSGQSGLQTFDGKRYTLQLSQVLFHWQTFSQRSQAKLVEDQLEAEYYGELAFLFSDVAEKYFNVLQADDALESIGSELAAINNQLNQIQSMFDRQLAQITDLYQAQASVAGVESEKLQLQSELALRQEALRSITGLATGPLFRLSDGAQILPLQNSINYWVQQAQSGNHRIKAREFQLQVATERISESRGAYMPRVSFIVQRQNSNIGFENSPVTQNDNTYLGLDVTIPLYAGGSNRAAVSEAHSQELIAQYQLQQEQLETSERVRSAYLQVQSSELRTEAARKLLESTTLSATAAQRGFELGTVTNVDVLNALRDQFRTERDLQKTRYEHVIYNLILKRETGILTAEDMLEVGSWLEAP
ncbi:MAG: TolC family outer membrane protein [Gammaproteobacteria bacterium]|nr:TolC family outer membrane protein [Gammaproteobacteria bacterium]